MRQIHAHRQEERKQREEDREAEEFENQMSMNLGLVLFTEILASDTRKDAGATQTPPNLSTEWMRTNMEYAGF